MVGCAMRTKMPTGRYLHGAHGAPYFDKTLNLLALSLSPIGPLHESALFIFVTASYKTTSG